MKFLIYITSISNAEICSKYKEKSKGKREYTQEEIKDIQGETRVVCRKCKNFILNSHCKIKKELIKNE